MTSLAKSSFQIVFALTLQIYSFSLNGKNVNLILIMHVIKYVLMKSVNLIVLQFSYS